MRRQGRLLAMAAGVLVPLAAAAQPTPFDGPWKVTMACPPHGGDDAARGYGYRFPGEVENGNLVAVHGEPEEPGWQRISGPIAADGSATLRVDGIVSNESYAIGKSPRGKPFTYRIAARFDANAGSGERLTGRTCTFHFER